MEGGGLETQALSSLLSLLSMVLGKVLESCRESCFLLTQSHALLNSGVAQDSLSLFCHLQVSLSQEELQALGSAISVVTQSGVLAVPEGELPGGDTGAVTVASTDGSEAQEVQTKLGASLLPLLEESCTFF